MRYFGNAILWIVLVALPLSAFAQHKKYTLSGTIYDSITGQTISDPHVSIAGTKYKTIGSEKGFYKIERLIPGTNNLVVWAEGYDSTIVRFEIRKNMKLNVKLMQILDTASLHIEEAADSAIVEEPVETIPSKTQAKPKKTKKKKKAKKESLTEKDKDEIKVLIEDVIFAKTIFFERFKNRRRTVLVWGSFTVDTGFLYTFKAKFSKKGGFELKWLDFKMKGKHAPQE